MTVLKNAETPTPLPGLHEVKIMLTESEWGTLRRHVNNLHASPEALASAIIVNWLRRQRWLQGHFDRSESQS